MSYPEPPLVGDPKRIEYFNSKAKDWNKNKFPGKQICKVCDIEMKLIDEEFSFSIHTTGLINKTKHQIPCFSKFYLCTNCHTKIELYQYGENGYIMMINR